jgi:hypothetical protein
MYKIKLNYVLCSYERNDNLQRIKELHTQMFLSAQRGQ